MFDRFMQPDGPAPGSVMTMPIEPPKPVHNEEFVAAIGHTQLSQVLNAQYSLTARRIMKLRWPLQSAVIILDPPQCHKCYKFVFATLKPFQWTLLPLTLVPSN
eukprot:3956123-Amphidinium_carterae.1